MTQSVLIAAMLGIVGVLARWGWSVYTRNKEIKRLEAEKKADIEIHSEQDKLDAENTNPPSMFDIANKL